MKFKGLKVLVEVFTFGVLGLGKFEVQQVWVVGLFRIYFEWEFRQVLGFKQLGKNFFVEFNYLKYW